MKFNVFTLREKGSQPARSSRPPHVKQSAFSTRQPSQTSLSSPHQSAQSLGSFLASSQPSTQQSALGNTLLGRNSRLLNSLHLLKYQAPKLPFTLGGPSKLLAVDHPLGLLDKLLFTQPLLAYAPISPLRSSTLFTYHHLLDTCLVHHKLYLKRVWSSMEPHPN
ncbi:hypothetical protein ACFE04_005803 [Oxalis oulophora]